MGTIFWQQKQWRNFGSPESITSWQETLKIQTKLATKIKEKNNNDDKNNAELLTEWMKATWKNFEETIRLDRKVY